METTQTRSKLTQVTTPNGRYYVDENGERLVSVTTCLNIIDKSAGLTKWAAELERDLVLDTAVTEFGRLQVSKLSGLSANDFRRLLNDALPKPFAHKLKTKEAADIGTEVHNAIERFLKKEPSEVVLGPEAQGAFNEFLGWWNKNTYEPLLVEERIYSLTHKYAGTVDMLSLAKVDGKPTIIDFKTSKYISWSYYLQLAAYREALTEMGYPRAEQGLIVKLPKTRGGKLELHPVTDLDTHFRSFILSLSLYKAQQEGDPWIKKRQEWADAMDTPLPVIA